MTATKQTELYTCIGKGGLYEYIGLSDGAGMSKGEQREVYRCKATGRVFHRECSDFSARMEPVAQSAEPVQGEAAGRFCGEFGGDVNGNMWFKVKTRGALPAPGAMLYTSPAKPDAELVELLSSCRGIVAREVERWNQVAARLLDKGAVESDLLKRIDAKLAELQGGAV
jgi:hypothetical protein